MSLSKLRALVMGREAWACCHQWGHRVSFNNWTTKYKNSIYTDGFTPSPSSSWHPWAECEKTEICRVKSLTQLVRGKMWDLPSSFWLHSLCSNHCDYYKYTFPPKSKKHYLKKFIFPHEKFRELIFNSYGYYRTACHMVMLSTWGCPQGPPRPFSHSPCCHTNVCFWPHTQITTWLSCP